MSKNNAVNATTKLVDILMGLSPEERLRAIRAAMILIGEAPPSTDLQVPSDADLKRGIGEPTQLPARARTWMTQNGIPGDRLQQVFHIADGVVEIIASVPGRNRKEQTYNAYILSGAAQLLATGNPSFQDKAARALCELSGCYDNTNHATYLKDRGNEFTGSKEKGWTLTAPGLRRAAELVKELSMEQV